MTFGLQLLGIVGASRYHARRDPLDLKTPPRIIDIPQSGTEASEICKRTGTEQARGDKSGVAGSGSANASVERERDKTT